MSARKGDVSPEELRSTDAWVRQLAARLVRDRDVADDLAQDALVVAWRRPPPPGVPFKSWVAGVLQNVHRVWRRGEGRRARREAVAEDDRTSIDLVRAWEEAEAKAALIEALQRLKPPLRDTLMLRYYEGLTSTEAAERLGIDPVTVRRRTQLALAALRRRLERKREQPTWMGAIVAFVRRTGTPARWSAAGAVVAAVAASAVWAPVHFGSVGEAARAGRERARSVARVIARTVRSTTWPSPTLPRTAEGRGGAASAPEQEMAVVSPAGAAHAEPSCGSLQALVDAAPAGSTVRVPPCTYRETVTIAKPLVLEGQGAELRGSDVWTEFRVTGARWTSVRALPRERCALPFDVYADDTRLVRVTDATAVAPGSFAVDAGCRLVLGDDPERVRVEVATRPRWLRVDSSAVVVRHLKMRHTVNPDGAGLTIHARARDVRLEANDLGETAGMALRVEGAGHVVADNEIARAAGVGVFLLAVADVRLERNRIHHNGGVGADAKGWQPGGIMATGRGIVMEGNELHDNFGSGIFCFESADVTVGGNRIFGNRGAGLAFLSSRRASVQDNRIWRNGWRAQPPEAGIFLTASTDSQVVRNTLAYNPMGVVIAAASDAPRSGGDLCDTTGGNAVTDNVIIDAEDFLASVWPHGDRPACATNQRARNWFSVTDGQAESDAPGLVPLPPAGRDGVLAASGIAGGDGLTK